MLLCCCSYRSKQVFEKCSLSCFREIKQVEGSKTDGNNTENTSFREIRTLKNLGECQTMERWRTKMNTRHLFHYLRWSFFSFLSFPPCNGSVFIFQLFRFCSATVLLYSYWQRIRKLNLQGNDSWNPKAEIFIPIKQENWTPTPPNLELLNHSRHTAAKIIFD